MATTRLDELVHQKLCLAQMVTLTSHGPCGGGWAGRREKSSSLQTLGGPILLNPALCCHAGGDAHLSVCDVVIVRRTNPHSLPPPPDRHARMTHRRTPCASLGGACCSNYDHDIVHDVILADFFQMLALPANCNYSNPHPHDRAHICIYSCACRYFCGPNAKKTAALAKQITKRRRNTAAAETDGSGKQLLVFDLKAPGLSSQTAFFCSASLRVSASLPGAPCRSHRRLTGIKHRAPCMSWAHVV